MGEARPKARPRGRVPAKVSQVLEAGDVVYVEPLDKDANTWRLRQVPEISGAIVAMDPATGRVLAMVGGFSFDQSQFNRATQALRQPGSSFKPFVYAAALDNGYTPSTVVMDAPIEIDQGPGMPPWRPENYSTGKFYGPSTLRFGIEHSRNVMTVRLAQDVGMPLIAEYAKRFGVYDDLPPYLSFALGAGETTRAAHGHRLFDVRQRRQAHHADADRPHPGPLRPHHLQARPARMPRLRRRQVAATSPSRRWSTGASRCIDPMTAYQITSMMEGVVQRGTATVVREVGKPIAGKTGTTNDEKDAWFVGFSPDLAVGVYLGYDKPRQIGRGATGGQLGGADRHGVPEGRARRQAGGAVPRAGRHQADPRRSADRHARRARASRLDPRSVQARHRAARQLFGRSASPIPRAGRSSAVAADRRRGRRGSGLSGRGLY